MHANYFLAIIFILALPSLIVPVYKSDDINKTYTIDEGSTLKLSGSSNVTSFTCVCDCYDESQKHSFKMLSPGGIDVFRFENNLLKLHADGLDCGHRGMNKDMFDMLKVGKYPYITIKLIKAKELDNCSLSETEGWVPLEAHTALTISGICQEFEMDVQAKQISDNKYRFKSSKTLSMDDFQLDPPSPMLGLVKVHDHFEIELDLIIHLVE
jgi:hypothetical protein